MDTSTGKNDCGESKPAPTEAAEQFAEDWTYFGFFDHVFRWSGLAWIIAGSIAGATAAVVYFITGKFDAGIFGWCIVAVASVCYGISIRKVPELPADENE